MAEPAGRPSGAMVSRSGDATETLEASAGDGVEQPRIKPMTTMSAGSGLAGFLLSPLADFLPNVVRVPLSTAVAGASFLPQGKQWLDEARAWAKARRRTGNDAD